MKEKYIELLDVQLDSLKALFSQLDNEHSHSYFYGKTVNLVHEILSETIEEEKQNDNYSV